MYYDVTIRERRMDSLFDLRGASPILAEVFSTCRFASPSRPNSVVIDCEDAVLWLGPERWIVRTSLDREEQIMAEFTAAIGERFANATVISDMLAGFELSGPQARDVLAQGCPLDLHPESFPPGSATATEIYGVAVILCLEDDLDRFTLYVDRSYADFVMGRLRNGAGLGATD